MLSEKPATVVAVSPQNAVDWMRFPEEIKMLILAQLVQEPGFLKHLLAFMQTSKESNELAHDAPLLRAAAQHWLLPQNISALSNKQINKLKCHLPKEDLEKFEEDFEEDVQERIADLEPYNASCEGLLLAAARGHVAMSKSFLQDLEEWKFPYYIGEALKIVAAEGYFDLALILTEALLKKNKYGRDLQLQSACRLALAEPHWDIVSFLIEQPACSNDSKLLNEVFNAAKQANQTALVKKLVDNHSAQLGLLEKLSMLTQPGLEEACDNVEKLFNNHSWLIKAPMCFGLRRLGYPRQNTKVDMKVVNELLAMISEDDCAESIRPARSM